MKKNVLLIDDDENFLNLTRLFLERYDWEVESFHSWSEAESNFTPGTIAVALVDLNIGEHDGLEIVSTLKMRDSRMGIGIITGHSSVESAVLALRLGVDDYITKPCENEEILIRLENMFSRVNKDEEIQALKNQIAGRYTFHNILTQDKQMIRVCELAKTIASTDSTVLLQGETGTGKEVFARAVHYDSTRAASPFIVVNCAGINENLLESHLFGHVKGAFTGAFETVPGKFEVVKDGTILLDEISETSLHFQKKLLRVLEERTFERVGDTKSIRCRGRVIAATNRNLKDMVRKNEFRSDLFFRLNVVPIVLPPLRERPGDIPLLAGHFLKVYGEKFRKPGMELTPELDEILLRHSWPGNVRELEHFIEKWVLVSGEGNVEPEMLLPREHAEHAETDAPQAIPPGMFDKNFQDFMNEAENAYFRHLMERYRGDVPRMAGHADTARKTIYAKIKRHSLKLD